MIRHFLSCGHASGTAQSAETGNLFTYHFTILRAILEKTASFHGHKRFSHCLKKGDGGPDDKLTTG